MRITALAVFALGAGPRSSGRQSVPMRNHRAIYNACMSLAICAAMLPMSLLAQWAACGSGGPVQCAPSGNVGIGTANPQAALDVWGTAYFGTNYQGVYPSFGSTIGSAGLAIGWNGQSGTHGETDFINFPGTSYGGFNFVLANNSGNVVSTPMVIQNSGNVGIGTTNPQAPLQVRAGANMNLQVTPSYAVSGATLIQAVNDGNNALTPMDIRAQYTTFSFGYVGIGTTNPTDALDVNGTIAATEVKVEASVCPTTCLSPATASSRCRKSSNSWRNTTTCRTFRQRQKSRKRD